MALLLVLALFVLFVLIEGLYVKYNGTVEPRPNTPRQAHTLGSGPELSYVVMGDSTAVAQGGVYAEGYATKTAEFLAKTNRVTWINVAVSGSRAKDVAGKQLPQALVHKPDVVLIGVGANDVTHLTSIGSVRASLASTIDQLRSQNPKVRIVLTGSPDMGSVPRFPQPVRWYAGKRTASLNSMVGKLADEKHVTFAQIAKETGPYFRKHPEAFAADKFHPTTQGYQLWTPVIIKALQ